jgi:hypothetical protein
MKDQLIRWFLPIVVENVINAFPEAKIKLYLDDLINLLEVRIEQSRNEIDDMFLPFLKMARDIFDIPDNDSAASTKKA